MSVSCSMASRCNGCAARPSAGASRIQLSVMAGRDEDVVDVGVRRGADLLLPRGFSVDRRLDRGDQVVVVGAQQFDEALFLAGEFAVEGPLGGLRVAHDVGDRRLAVTAFGDGVGKSVEQPLPKGATPRVGRGCVGHSGFHVVASKPLRTCGTGMYRTTHADGTPQYHDRGWRDS